MPFPRSGQGDQRRRRVLIEEHRSESPPVKETAGRESSGSDGRHAPASTIAYPAAALAERQPSIMALIPRRRWTLAVLLLAGLSVIAALEAAYGQLWLQPQALWSCEFKSLDLQARGELAACFSSLLLAAAAVQSWLLYRLRRHRLDDYRGRYRLWTWIPLVWGAMGLGVSTHLGDDLTDLIGRSCGCPVSQMKGLWIPLILGGAWLMVACALAVEVRRSRASLVFLAIATGGYLAANVIGSGLLTPASEVLRVMAVSTSAMVGYLATFLAIATYSRHVFLEVHGMLRVRTRGKTEAKRKRTPRPAKAETKSKQPPPAAAEPVAKVAEKRGQATEGSDSPATAPPRKTLQEAPPPQPAASPVPALHLRRRPRPGQSARRPSIATMMWTKKIVTTTVIPSRVAQSGSGCANSVARIRRCGGPLSPSLRKSPTSLQSVAHPSHPLGRRRAKPSNHRHSPPVRPAPLGTPAWPRDCQPPR